MTRWAHAFEPRYMDCPEILGRRFHLTRFDPVSDSGERRRIEKRLIVNGASVRRRRLVRSAHLSTLRRVWNAKPRELFRELRSWLFAGSFAFIIVLTVSCKMAYADPIVHVYAIRGFAGVLFSRGMNKLCEELKSLPKVECTVADFYSSPKIKDEASLAWVLGQKLVFVGHSWGAHAALQIASTIPGSVSLVVTIDPNWFPPPPLVPNNAEVVLNYYQDFDMLGRSPLMTAPGYSGILLQFLRNEGHVLIDASPDIHAEIVNRIGNILANPTARSTKNLMPPTKLPRRPKLD
jgi:hypothetical protein